MLDTEEAGLLFRYTHDWPVSFTGWSPSTHGLTLAVSDGANFFISLRFNERVPRPTAWQIYHADGPVQTFTSKRFPHAWVEEQLDEVFHVDPLRATLWASEMGEHFMAVIPSIQYYFEAKQKHHDTYTLNRRTARLLRRWSRRDLTLRRS